MSQNCVFKNKGLMLTVLSGSSSRLKMSVTRRQESSLVRGLDPLISIPWWPNLNHARSDSACSPHAVLVVTGCHIEWGVLCALLCACVQLRVEASGTQWCYKPFLAAQDYVLLFLSSNQVMFCGNSCVWKKEKALVQVAGDFIGDGGLSGSVFWF